VKALKLDESSSVSFPLPEELIGSVIFLLGAGFTKGYNEEIVPLISDFLQVSERQGVLKPDHEHKEFVAFVNKYFGDYKEANIETLATFLSLQLPPVWSFRSEPRDYYYKTLIEIIVRTLSRIYSRPGTDDVKSAYQSFARALMFMRSIVLTFNYDTLLDNLLRETKRWSVISGYGIEMRTPLWEYTKDHIRQELLFVSREMSGSNETVRYLKLHGSLNWGKLLIDPPYGNPSVYVDTFGFTSLEINKKGEGPDPIDVFSNSGVGPHQGSGFSVRGEPFIVPPIMSKEELFREPLLLNLWYHAMNHFSTAEDIIVIGYSFPPTDFLATLSIRQGLANRFGMWRDKKVKVWFVDKAIDEQYKLRASAVFLDCELQFLRMDTVQFLKNWLT
jgi:hypothetical protein